MYLILVGNSEYINNMLTIVSHSYILLLLFAYSLFTDARKYDWESTRYDTMQVLFAAGNTNNAIVLYLHAK